MDLRISFSSIPSILQRFISFIDSEDETNSSENEENSNNEEDSEQISIPLFTIEQNTQEYIIKSFLIFLVSSLPYVFILLLLFIYLNYKSTVIYYLLFN